MARYLLNDTYITMFILLIPDSVSLTAFRLLLFLLPFQPCKRIKEPRLNSEACGQLLIAEFRVCIIFHIQSYWVAFIWSTIHFIDSTLCWQLILRRVHLVNKCILLTLISSTIYISYIIYFIDIICQWIIFLNCAINYLIIN